MKHDPQVWSLALKSLDAGVPVALLYVVESLGSSPGRAGFAMTVTATQASGSIGGGAMEHRFVAQARQALTDKRPAFLQRQVHDAKAAEDASGMICSGEQTFWLGILDSGDRTAVSRIAANTISGVLRLGPRGLSFDPATALPYRQKFEGGADWTYQEDLGHRDKLHLVGGGHCSLALSRLAETLDFEITVYDDRPQLPTFEANVWAHHKVLVADYSVMGTLINPGEEQFVCVMTFGYKTDDVALRVLMPHDFGFLGALGSRSKIDKLMAAYSAEGFDPRWLRRIHAPLGLPIHSQTPAEIAVSIAAQLIRTRNELTPPLPRSPA